MTAAFIFSNPANAQSEPEFLLVGVFHHIPENQACNWQATYQKILHYHPDQIAVEYVIPSDSASQVYVLGANYQPKWDSLILAWEGKKINPEEHIQQLLGVLSQKEDPQSRLNLWKYYHLGMDLGNRDYQTYLIQQNFDRYLAVLDTAGSWGKNFLKRHRSTVEGRKNSEFFNLVFPLAKTCNIAYIHPTDDKITYPTQSEAYGKFAEELANTAHMKKYEAFWEEFNATETRELARCNGLPFVNSRKWLKKSDYGQAHILENAKNPNYTEYARVWYKRNESIANRIIEAAKKSGARKMAVFYGYMHIAPVKKFLEQQGYKVKLIGNLK